MIHGKLLFKLLPILVLFPLAASAQYQEYSYNNNIVGPQSQPVTVSARFGNPFYETSTLYLSSVTGSSNGFTVQAPSVIYCCTTEIDIPVVFDPTGLAPGNYFTQGQAVYGTCQGCQDAYVLNFSFSATAAADGSIYPKYLVLSVIYAPPGPKSSVDYESSTVQGTCNSWDNMFSTSTTLTTSLGATIPVFGSTTRKNSSTWTQSEDTTSSICLNKSTSSDIIVPGPADPNAGIDHDYDIVRIWVNPVANFEAVSSNSAQWSYSFDQRDPANEMDVVDLYVSELKNPSTIDSGTAQVLARTWAGSGQGLTNADYAAILARNPFGNGQTTVDSTRFDLEGGETFQYQPPPPGGQPTTETLSQSYQTTSTQGRTATDTYQVSYSFSGSAKFLQWLSANATFESSQTLTWTNKASTQNTQTTGGSAKFSITGPPYLYSGPVDVQVYQDNVYGSFMFDWVQ